MATAKCIETRKKCIALLQTLVQSELKSPVEWAGLPSLPITLSADQITRCSREPGDDGVGKAGSSWSSEPEFLELPEEEHPLLGLLRQGRDVLLPLQVPRDGQPWEAARLHGGHQGLPQHDGRRGELYSS